MVIVVRLPCELIKGTTAKRFLFIRVNQLKIDLIIVRFAFHEAITYSSRLNTFYLCERNKGISFSLATIVNSAIGTVIALVHTLTQSHQVFRTHDYALIFAFHVVSDWVAHL